MFFSKEQFRWTIGRRILARSGLPARAIRSGNLFPTARSTPFMVARDAGLGDVLMATPLLRQAKLRYPGLRTIFYTSKYAPLVRGLPYIDEILPFEARPADAIYLKYEDAIPPRAPLPQIFADWVGLPLDSVVPDCVTREDLVAHFRASWAELPRPHIIVLRRAGRWTPNKDWPDLRWAELMARLGGAATLIEIGEGDMGLIPISAPNYVDLRGQTGLEELAAAIAAADLYVGPVSGPMHIAAGVRTPAVTICGGYEHPIGCSFPNNHMLYTAVPCAPCWLQGPCPNQHACLTAISVDDVEKAVRQMLRQE